MTAQYVHSSVKGPNRAANEDGYLVLEDKGILIFFLFDGVGGAMNGRKGVELAVSNIEFTYRDYCSPNHFDAVQLLLDTNQFILKSGIPEALTTVCSCAFLSQGRVLISNIGDTRAYSFTFQSLNQLSKDHKFSNRSNVLTKCLGMTGLMDSDINECVIQKLESNILLCTDGFYALLEAKLGIFLKLLNSKNIKMAKKRIDNLIVGQNTDDASYIIISK